MIVELAEEVWGKSPAQATGVRQAS
jgi:hypothetical protein